RMHLPPTSISIVGRVLRSTLFRLDAAIHAATSNDLPPRVLHRPAHGKSNTAVEHLPAVHCPSTYSADGGAPMSHLRARISHSDYRAAQSFCVLCSSILRWKCVGHSD